MPFERREILFYLTELKQAVLDSGEVIDGKLSSSSSDVQILDALHTRDFHSSFHDIQARFRTLYAQRGGREGVMFRVSANGMFRKDQVIGMIVRDSVMERVLLKACKDFNIGLPRAAQKTIVAKDLAIGFEFIFDTAGLMLEEVY